MPSPTFFLAGAPKAGTTSLFRYLARHPDVAVARVKEPCYFAPEVPVDAATDVHRQSWPSYLALFADAGSRRAIGEGSVAYFSSATAPISIRERLPEARVLVMLRDPAERLFAHYAAARVAGITTGTFPQWVAAQQALEDQRPARWGAVWAGCYATHLTRYRAHFAPDHLHIEYYDDFVRDPDRVLARVFQFIGVDHTIRVDRSDRHNVTTTARFPRAMTSAARVIAEQALPARAVDALRRWSRRPARMVASPADRAHGIALYRHEIAALSSMTGRDLTAWLSPSE